MSAQQMDLPDLQECVADYHYPAVPGYKAAGTSSESAAKVGRARAANLRDRVMAALKSGPKTADECAAAIGETAFSVRPRLSELRKVGDVLDSKERRVNASGHRAVVWQMGGAN